MKCIGSRWQVIFKFFCPHQDAGTHGENYVNSSKTTEDSEAADDKVIQALWWMVLVRGLLLIGFGALILFKPGSTLLGLLWIMGIYWIVDGLFSLVQAFVGKPQKSRLWLVFAGALSIFGGLLILGNPLTSAVVGGVFLVYLVGVTIIVSGLLLVFVGGSKNGQKKKRGLSSMLMGALYVLFGLFIVTHPVLTMSAMAWLFGTWALFSGAVAVVLALRLRRKEA